MSFHIGFTSFNVFKFKVAIEMLDCSPNLAPVNATYQDESERFHESPDAWLNANLNRLRNVDYIVMYDKMYGEISETLRSLGFTFWNKFYHTLLLFSNNESRYVVIFKKDMNSTQ